MNTEMLLPYVFKTDEEIDIKNEMPEAISFPPIKTEQEVRLWGLCEVLATHDFRPFITPLNKGNCEMTFIYSLLFVILCVHLSFEIWISILKRRDFLEVIAINGRLILKCIFKK